MALKKSKKIYKETMTQNTIIKNKCSHTHTYGATYNTIHFIQKKAILYVEVK